MAVNPGKRFWMPTSSRSAPRSANSRTDITTPEDLLELRLVLLLLRTGERAEDARRERLLVGEDQLVLGEFGVDRRRGLLRADDGVM